MRARWVLQVGSGLWAVLGAAIAWSAMGTVNADARAIVLTASIVGPLAALGAAVALGADRGRIAGLLLLVSVLTPTYFAAVANVPALAVGLALLVAPRRVLGVPVTPAVRRPAC